MPSTNKTPLYGLNQWIGTDKPVRDDFNRDNQLIEAAIAAASGGGSAPVIGTYSGDGQEERLIDLGFAPAFGVVFAIEKNLSQSVGATGDMIVMSGFFAQGGASAGIYTEATGFTVIQSDMAMDNSIYSLNQTGLTYIYIAWR